MLDNRIPKICHQTITIIVCTCCLAFLSGCSRHKDLYKITDKFVESLYTEYESYGLGGTQEYTPDRAYKVMPIFRLINVRIEKAASDDEYEDLINDLKAHYKGNPHVNDVYRCQAGTIMIDCRK